MRLVRVLLSARDPGGAAQVRAVAPALRADPRAAVSVTASGPAFDILKAAGQNPERFVLPDGSVHQEAGVDPAPLLGAAQALLDRADPDALVVGISSLGVGVDEALLARAGGRPTFALQDYPGDANAIAGAYAGRYFVRDEAAARLTRARFGAEAVPVGSLRHQAYARLDVPALRASTRAQLGAGDHPVVGFFGQPPDIPGHEAAFGHLVEALAARRAKPLLVLREHPKSRDRRAAHLDALRAAGVRVHDATDAGAVERWLAACDVVTTCFSHCAMDSAFLSAHSPEPLGSVLFLLTTSGAREFMRAYTGMPLPDGVEQGLGLVAESSADVGRLLERALTRDEQRAFHAASLRLPRAARLDLIVETVVEAGRQRMARVGAPS